MATESWDDILEQANEVSGIVCTDGGYQHTEKKFCGNCGSEEYHGVRIELREEGDDGNVFSREPYRIVECLGCSTSYSQRMNNA